MPDYRFKIGEELRTSDHVVARAVSLAPFFKDGYHSNLATCLKRLVAKRRSQLTRLEALGWFADYQKKYKYVRNCPPAGVMVKPRPQPCCQRFCPFCHGRVAGERFVRLLRKLDLENAAIIERHHRWAINPLPAGHEALYLRQGVVQKIAGRKKTVRRLQARAAVCAFYLEPARTGYRGAIRQLFVVDRDVGVPDWLAADANKRMTHHNVPSTETFLQAYCRLTMYPRSWLYCDAAALAAVLAALGASRVVECFGSFRGD